MATSPSSSPEGLKLIPGYRVGRRIGSGAQASVHLLEPTTKAKNASSSPLPTYAVKIAPVPAKITKKGLSEAEINARSIDKEYKLYSNHFNGLRDEGMMASMPYRGGVPPFGTKDGMYSNGHIRNESVLRLYYILLLFSLVSHNAHLFLLAFNHFAF
jgi:hypothetical protein